jgi:hypothetical protein
VTFVLAQAASRKQHGAKTDGNHADSSDGGSRVTPNALGNLPPLLN